MPASTTTATKNPTPAAIRKALDSAYSRVAGDFSTTDWAKAAELVCKLMSKYVKEELDL